MRTHPHSPFRLRYARDIALTRQPITDSSTERQTELVRIPIARPRLHSEVFGNKRASFGRGFLFFLALNFEFFANFPSCWHYSITCLQRCQSTDSIWCSMRNTANGIDQLLLNPSQQKTRFFLRAEALKRVAHLMLSFVRFFIILYGPSQYVRRKSKT